jgi:hypothetical protein
MKRLWFDLPYPGVNYFGSDQAAFIITLNLDESSLMYDLLSRVMVRLANNTALILLRNFFMVGGFVYRTTRLCFTLPEDKKY